MSDEQKFEFETYKDAAAVKEYLNAVMDGIERGRIILSSAEEEMELQPADSMKFKVEAKKKPGKGKLSIKISWKDDQDKQDESQ